MTTSPDLTSEILRYRSLVAAEKVLLALAELLPPGPHQRAEWLRIKLNLAFRNFQLALVKYVAGELKAGFNPDQPRVPAGNPDGGQWTGEGSDNAFPSQIDTKPVVTVSTPGMVLSDASPDPIEPGARYAGPLQITIDASALTGISAVDETTKSLTATLATTAEAIDYIPGLSPQAYGRLVHQAFATALRLGQVPGIGFFDVETTFGPAPESRYGSKGSIRTDVVLRNLVGDIVAIYDVKTGEKGLEPSRVSELRAKARTGPQVPVIELHLTRGVSLKCVRVRRRVFSVGLRYLPETYA